MKRYVKFSLILVIVLLSIFLFASCGVKKNSNNNGNNGGNNNTKIEKVQLTDDMVKLRNNYFTSDGTREITIDYDIEIAYKGTQIDTNQFSYTYENNKEFSKNGAKVTVKCKDTNPYLYGSAVAYFSIFDNKEHLVSTVEEINELFNNGHIRAKIDNGVTLVVNKDEKLLIQEVCSLHVYGTLINYGTIEIASKPNEEGSGGLLSNQNEIINTSTGLIVNNDRFSNSGSVYNDGTFTNNGTASNAGSFYTTDNDNITFNWGNNPRDAIKRTNIVNNINNLGLIRFEGSKYINVDKNENGVFEIPYNKDGYFISLKDTEYISSSFYIIDEITNAGTYLIHLDFSAINKSTKYYGSSTLSFDVVKSVISINNEEELIEAISNSNYYKYTYSLPNNLVINSEITIPKDCILENTYSYNIQISSSGNLVNNGTVLNSNSSFVIYGSLTNNGDIETKGLIDNNLVTNIGNIICTQNGMNVNGTFNNQGTLELIGTNTNFFNSIVENTGVIINNESKINIENSDESNFNNINGVIQNENGIVYLYSAIENIDKGEVVIKKDISNISSLSATTFDYDGNSHIPKMLIEEKTFPYLRTTTNISDTTSIGTIKLTSVVNNYFCEYYGSSTLEYRILPVEKIIGVNDDFKRCISNLNYNKFTLGKNISISYATDILSISAPLDLNGYSLILDNVHLAVYSNLIAPSINEENKNGIFFTNIILYGSSILTVEKELQNDGSIYLESGVYSKLRVKDITGTGKIYVDENKNIRLTAETNENEVIERQNIESLSNENLYLDNDVLVYNGSIQNPNVYIYDGNSNVNNYNLDIIKPDSKVSGEYELTVKLESIYFDPLYYGQTKLSYSIVPNVLDLYDSPAIETSFDIDKHDMYILKENITKDVQLIIPSGATLDLGSFRITKLEENKDSRLILQENAELFVNVNSKEDFDKYKYIATKITLTGNIEESLSIDFKDEIIDGYVILNNVSGYNPYLLTIDLNGYNIGKTTSDFGNNALIIRNEVTSSKTLFNKQLDKVRLNITNSSDNISEINTGVDKKYAGITYYSLEGKTLDFNITGKVNSKEKNNIKIEGIALAKGVQTTNVVIGYSILYVTNVDISTLINKATHCVYVPSVNGALVNFTNCNIRGYRYGVEILGGIENKYHMFLNCNIVADSGTAVQAQFYAEDKYSSYFNINVYDCSLTGNYGVYISISGISLRKTKVRIYVRNNTYNTTVANTGYSKGAFYPPQNPIIEE